MRTIPVRRKGLDPREHQFLVQLPRAWGRADTLDQAIENARVNLPETDREEVEATVYLITPDTGFSTNPMTGATFLDEIRGEDYLDAEPESEWIEEGNGIEVMRKEDGDDEKLEFMSNIVINTSRPEPEEV